ncbi:MAG: hypothetical protein A2149_02985 [Candidatus Schekmanbacteria bacterium RBG_16_38_11]|uniref:Uncharacterized protein n=1 Tax=Candidatus Schekmanbacteria bacterium RBG_16_38_11 TaxID=1817880 RepID=A0A1F7RSL6_9BACT|nr:MAG: hypothetical protein A2149_02985 [Candidatus Schekmanbacteria bacterium RBG_16_38_11]
MQVLLINPPLSTACPTGGVYPMGMGYIGAMLKKAQCGVDVFDIRLNKYDKLFVADFLKKNQGKYGLFGISGMVTAYNYGKWVSQEIKKYNPGAVIVAGGSICTAGELLLRNSEIDIICIGEGEKVIVDIVEAIRFNKDFITIPNILIKRDGDITYTKKETPIDINSVPFPAWELFDMGQYTNTPYIVPVDTPSITMITERGCPFECSFCYRNFGRKLRHRDTKSVIEEIKTVIDRFGIGHIDFLDEIFNVNPKQVIDLCENIIREDIKVTWRCIGRTDFVDRDVLQLMYEAGCRWIGYGIESGSQKMLDRMNKRQKIGDIENSIKLSREAGMIVTGTFIIGMPEETEETIQESRDFLRRNKIFNIPFFPVPYPGTILYDECKEKGIIGNDESYVASLEKDATELIINLTEIPDSRLIELRNSLSDEFKEFIPSMKLAMKEDKAILKNVLNRVTSKIKEITAKRT